MNDTQTIINILNKLKDMYDDDPPLLQFFLELGMNNHSNISCIAFYKRFILENTDKDFTEEDIKKIENLYVKSKKYLNILNRLVYNYKIKKAIKYNDEDLFFNKISDYKPKHIVKLYSNNTIYAFKISDLINLWTDCLIKSENLFCKTEKLKNPYTNIEFSKTNLYNIFFAIKNSDYIVPSWILLFFYEDFNIKAFTYKYYSRLKDIAIISFIKDGPLYEKIENIDNMLHEYKNICKHYILKDNMNVYDKLIVSKILNEPLKMYLISTLSCNPLLREDNKYSLKKWLRDYFKDKDNEDLDIYFTSTIRIYRRPITINPLTRRILNAANQIMRDPSRNTNILRNIDNEEDLPLLSTNYTINDISFINPFVPNHTIPRSPTRNTVIRNITSNHPPLFPPPPPIPSQSIQNRYVNIPIRPIPPPPITQTPPRVILPPIDNNLDSEGDVIMENVEQSNNVRFLSRTRRRRRGRTMGFNNR